MFILGSDSNNKYDTYVGSICVEYEFVECGTYCKKRAEILTLILTVINAKLIDKTNTSLSEATWVEENCHMYIYATKKGRELWEDQALGNLRREINMLRQGLIPCLNNLGR